MRNSPHLRRFRTPLEIDGVCAFWEDRLFDEDESNAVRFTIGDAPTESGKLLRVGDAVSYTRAIN